eukprot:8913184-Prorocentrum_lima.AAC.1
MTSSLVGSEMCIRDSLLPGLIKSSLQRGRHVSDIKEGAKVCSRDLLNKQIPGKLHGGKGEECWKDADIPSVLHRLQAA